MLWINQLQQKKQKKQLQLRKQLQLKKKLIHLISEKRTIKSQMLMLKIHLESDKVLKNHLMLLKKLTETKVRKKPHLKRTSTLMKMLKLKRTSI